MDVGKTISSAFTSGLGNVVTGAIGSIGSSFVDKLLGNDPNKSNQQMMAQQNAFNAAEAQKNRDFQLAMFNRTNKYNSPKEQVARMVEAGLNPDLMYGGNGSSVAAQSPSGAQASSAGMIPKLDMQLRAAEINKTNAEAQLIKSQTGKTDADTETVMTYNKWQEQILSGQVDMNNVNIRLGNSNIDVNEATSRKLYAEATKLDAEVGEVYAKIDKLGAELRNLDADTALKKLEHMFQSETFNDRVEQVAANLKKTYSDIALNGAQIKNLLESLIIQRCQLAINQQNADTNRLNAYTAMDAQETNSNHLRVVDGKLQFDFEVEQGKHTNSRAAKAKDNAIELQNLKWATDFVKLVSGIGLFF